MSATPRDSRLKVMFVQQVSLGDVVGIGGIDYSEL